jgi:UDP-glucose 4-epimerase
MKKVLVTGGAGYIGSHTVVELAQAGYEPIIVDNFSNSERGAIEGIEKIIKKKVKLHIGDCSDYEFMSTIFGEERNIEGLIHFAAFKAVGESVDQPLKYYDNNIGSLVMLLKMMSQYNVTNMVFSSSCTVYGEPENLPVTELSPRLKANSPYGNTKQICEDIINDVAESSNAKMKAIALRYFNPVGAHPSGDIGELPIGTPNNLVPYVLQTAAGIREQLTVYGNDYETPDGTCIRDYIHVVDLAKSHVQAINYLVSLDGKHYYDTFNIGTGVGNSVLEVIQKFESLSGVRLNYVVGKRREGDVEVVYGNVNKARTIMNWKAELTLSDALRDAWRWQQQLGK